MSRSRRALLGLVSLVLLSAVLVVMTPAWAATVGSSATSVTPGQVVVLSGSEFEPDESVKLCWDGDDCANLGRATTGEVGSFTANVIIPADATAGVHTISACQRVTTEGDRLLCGRVSVSVVIPEPTTTTTQAPTTTTTTTLPTTTSTTLDPTTTTSTTLPTTTTTLPTPTTTRAVTTTSTTRATPTTADARVTNTTTSPGLTPTTTSPASTTTTFVTTTSTSLPGSGQSDSDTQAAPARSYTTTSAPTTSNGGNDDGSRDEQETEVLGESIVSESASQSAVATAQTANWPLVTALLTAAAVLLLLAIRLIIREIRGAN